MTTLKKFHPTTSKKLTASDWNKLMLTANEFVFAAQDYKKNPELRHVAAFLLHEATVISLTAVKRLQALSTDGSVEIPTLLKALAQVSPEISTVLPRATAKEEQLFEMLVAAGDITQTKASPIFTEAAIDALLEAVCALITHVETAHKLNKRRKLIAYCKQIINPQTFKLWKLKWKIYSNGRRNSNIRRNGTSEPLFPGLWR